MVLHLILSALSYYVFVFRAYVDQRHISGISFIVFSDTIFTSLTTDPDMWNVVLPHVLYIHVSAVRKTSYAFNQSWYETNALESLGVLQKEFYNESNGLWQGYNDSCGCYSTFWWNSANCVSTLADLTALNKSETWRLTYPIFRNTYIKAQRANLMQQKLSSADPHGRCVWPWTWTCPNGKPRSIVPKGFINDYWDDAGWWGLAWIAVYDLTGDQEYLDTAVNIWQHMAFQGYNSTCGGMWWDTAHTQMNAIVNELFLSLSAHLARRAGNKDYYLTWATRQLKWFLGSGLLTSSGLVVDGLNPITCYPTIPGPTYSYNQGVILGALVELDKAVPDSKQDYLGLANTIAQAAIANLTNDHGVLTEYFNGMPGLGFDGPTFKGVFIRNLQVLQQATGDLKYAAYSKKNADSIWRWDRSPENGTLGDVWDNYKEQVLPQGHCAAMDALVAAAATAT